MAYLTDETVADLAGGVAHRDRIIDKIKKKAKEKEHVARGLAGVAAGSMAFSYLDARYSDDGVEWKPFGVPVSLAAAGLLHFAGLSGYGYGKWVKPDDLHSIANGAFAVWMTQWGRDFGHKARTKPVRHGTAGMGAYGAGALPAPGQRYAVDMNGVPAYG